MFYEVKVLDALGNIKKIISSKSLSSKHWSRHEEAPDTKMTFDFEELEEDYSLNKETVSGKRQLFKMDDSAD